MSASQLVRIEVISFVAALALVVFWKLVTLRIMTRGLLTDPRLGGLSPARLQLLMTTLVGAVSYASELTRSQGVWPEPGVGLLAVVGGSNAIHLGMKLWSSTRGSRYSER